MTAPQKSECPGPAGQVAEQNTESTASVPLAAAEAKRAATLKARLALRRYEARMLPGGAGYVVGRWGLFKHCATLDELHAFAVRVGATC